MTILFLRHRFVRRGFAVVCLVATRLHGAAPTHAEETVMALDPFVVTTEKDTGYIASDTMSGSRLSTNLLKTPTDITVLTKDFFDDIAAFQIADAETYLTSAAPAAPAPGGFTFGADVAFRGLPTAVNVRNYFSYPLTPNAYIVDRIEGARGSNSILYGPSLSGGLVNVLTKQAQFRNFETIQVKGDAWGSRSVAVDLNRKVSPNLSVRVNAVTQHQRNWIAGYYDNLDAADLAATYHPWKGASLRIEGEAGNRKVAYVPNAFLDNFSSWNGTPVAGPLTSAPAGSGISKITTDYLVVSPNWAGIQNWNAFGKSTGTGLSVVDRDRPFNGFPVLVPKSFRNMPANNYYDIRNYDGAAIFDQTLPDDTVVEVAIHRSDCPEFNQYANMAATYVDVNKVMPDGVTPNPEFGKLYSESTDNVGTLNQYRTEYRLAAEHSIKTSWLSQSFSLIVSGLDTTYDPRVNTVGRTNGTSAAINNAANNVRFRRYWDTNQDALYVSPQNQGIYTFGYLRTRDSYIRSDLRAYQVNTIGTYLHDSLTVIGGIRRDDYYAKDREIATTYANAQPATFATATTKKWVTTRNLGAVYFPVPSIGIYASYSEGYNPSIPNYPRLNGDAGINSTADRGHAAGVRFRLFDGAVVGSIGYYDAREGTKTQTISTTAVNQIWNDLGLPQKQIVGGSYPDYLDSFDYKAHGYEADFTANLTNRFRMIVNGAIPRTEQANGLPDTNAYYQANIAQWQAGTLPSSGLSAATSAQINTDIQAIQSVLTNGTNGRVVNGTYKWRVNAFGIYTFDSGMLRHLRIGGGTNLFGPQEIGSPAGQPFTYVYSPRYATVALLAGYSFKVARRTVDLQVNASNIFNYNDPIFSSVTTVNGGTYRNAYYYNPPRSFALSAKIQ